MRVHWMLATLAMFSGFAHALPIPGGGPAETDCHAEFAATRMRLNFPPHDPATPVAAEEVHCFDGDAGCDLDGAINGACVFDIDVCLYNDDPALPACQPEEVVSALAGGDGDVQQLNDALSGLLPAASPVCTDGATLSISAGGRGTVEVEVTTAGDVQDEDSLPLVCVVHDWPAHGSGYASHNSNPAETTLGVDNVLSLGTKWQFDIATFEGGRGGSVTSTPVVGNGMVYVTAWNGKLYALDEDSGAVVWQHTGAETTFLGLEGSPALTADGRVIVTNDRIVECLDARDGTLLWQTTVSEAAESEMWGGAVVANGRVFVGVASKADSPCASDGQITALDLDSGEVLWRYVTTPERICSSDTAVECTTNDECPRGGECIVGRGAGITSRPATDESGEIVFTNTVGCFTYPSIGDSDSLFAFDAASGDLLWKNRVQPPEQFGFCPDDDARECRDDSDCSNGSCMSKALFHDFGFLNGPLYLSAAESGFAGGLVVSGSKDGTLYAVDPATGTIVWRNVIVPTPVSPGLAAWGLFNGSIAYSDGHIFAALHDTVPSARPDHLQAFRISDGANVWSQPFMRTWGDTTTANGVVFTGDCGPDTTCNSACRDMSCPAGTLYAIGALDGTILKSIALPSASVGSTTIVRGSVYVPYGLSGTPGGVMALAAACPGDCDGDGNVGVSELIRIVGWALGDSDGVGCSSCDRNGDNEVAINEIITAVRSALEGC